MVECPLCGRNVPFSKLRVAFLSGCLNYPIGDDGPEPRSRQLTGWLPHEQNDWTKQCLRDLWSQEAMEIRQTPVPAAVVPPVVARVAVAQPIPVPVSAPPVVENGDTNKCQLCARPFTNENPQCAYPVT